MVYSCGFHLQPKPNAITRSTPSIAHGGIPSKWKVALYVVGVFTHIPLLQNKLLPICIHLCKNAQMLWWCYLRHFVSWSERRKCYKPKQDPIYSQAGASGGMNISRYMLSIPKHLLIRSKKKNNVHLRYNDMSVGAQEHLWICLFIWQVVGAYRFIFSFSLLLVDIFFWLDEHRA